MAFTLEMTGAFFGYIWGSDVTAVRRQLRTRRPFAVRRQLPVRWQLRGRRQRRYRPIRAAGTARRGCAASIFPTDRPAPISRSPAPYCERHADVADRDFQVFQEIHDHFQQDLRGFWQRSNFYLAVDGVFYLVVDGVLAGSNPAQPGISAGFRPKFAIFPCFSILCSIDCGYVMVFMERGEGYAR